MRCDGPHPQSEQCPHRPLRRSRTLPKAHMIERFFSRLKHFRGIATRYFKTAANFLAAIHLAAARLWIRSYESTT
ncbi:transposase [Devosia albogilva]|uniref:Transposase n=1 Tax=Devosia albogilva TaxID=429726 RepID=A0ABW5QLS5_9HYPH